MKFKDFRGLVLFSSTFKALNLGEKIQVISRMRGNPAHNFDTRVEIIDHISSYTFLFICKHVVVNTR